MQSVKGKIVLVAGATGGIGSETVKLLMGSGAIVYITGRNLAKLNQLAENCRILPTKYL